MLKYFIRRVLMVPLIVLGVILIIFVILYFLPYSNMNRIPAYAGGDALDSVFSFFNAGDNFITKYIRYSYNVFKSFDFSLANTTRMNLSRELNYRIRNTMLLLASGVSATLVIGIPVGVYAAVHKNRVGDRILNLVTMILSSLPSYSVAMVITLIFVLYLRIWPLFISYTSPRAFFLPALTIALGGVSSVVRMTRTSLLEVLDQPYITALRSKGLKETDVIYRHALKNALIPIISVLGGLISQLLFGTLVVEYFFGVPGLGSFTLISVSTRDHISILAGAVLLTIVLSATNIASDLLYAFVNPQIKLRYSNVRRKETQST